MDAFHEKGGKSGEGRLQVTVILLDLVYDWPRRTYADWSHRSRHELIKRMNPGNNFQQHVSSFSI